MRNRSNSTPTSVGYLEFRKMLKSRPSLYNSEGGEVKERKHEEDDECKRLVFELDQMIEQKKIIQYTHIPNETYTPYHSVRTRNRLLGVKGGFPDYVVITPQKALFIEMKKLKGGTTSPLQREWIDNLNFVGLEAVVCNGWEEAVAFIESHLTPINTN